MDKEANRSDQQIEKLLKELSNFKENYNISADAAHAFMGFYNLLKTRGNEFNLVAKTDFKTFLYRHVCDSLEAMRATDIKEDSIIIDIGSGAGFPGIPLKIMLPGIRLVSIESVGKKANFQREVKECLRLVDFEVIKDRSELIARTELREKADVVLSRAVASISVIAELSLPFLKIGGEALLFKGIDIEKELEEGRSAISVCGGALKKIYHYSSLNESIERRLVIIEKIKPTPSLYPRQPGIPKKHPL